MVGQQPDIHFSAKDKEILSGYIPINLCLSCPAKGGCCGCPKHREYLDWMYVHFGEDKECTTLLNQTRDYALKSMQQGEESKVSNILAIIIGVLAILLALKFIKTIGKVIFSIILVITILVLCYGVFDFNIILFVVYALQGI